MRSQEVSAIPLRVISTLSSLAGILVATLLLSGCAINHHFQVASAGGVTPPFIELHSDRSIATLHFPRGLYSLYAADDTGYYYQAPRKIIQHGLSGVDLYDGGIFVSKRRPIKIRGYIIWAGGVTKVGQFPHAELEFHD